MYLQRKMDSFLSGWHADANRLPLIVKGPRQIGKTESILHFAHATYSSVVAINCLFKLRAFLREASF